MVTATLPPPSDGQRDALKTFPGKKHDQNGTNCNGQYVEQVRQSFDGVSNKHANGSNGRTGHNGHLGEPICPPQSSADAIFGPRDTSAKAYRMLNQPLGQRRRLKIIYLGGGASGQPKDFYRLLRD